MFFAEVSERVEPISQIVLLNQINKVINFRTQFLREVLYFFNLRDDELRRQILERRLKNDISFSNKDLISLAPRKEGEVDDAEIITLSPAKRILCDGLHTPLWCTLDGNGRKIVLPHSVTKHSSSLICVGNFRTLTIRNAVIEGDVERFISLGTRSNIIYDNVIKILKPYYEKYRYE